MTKHRKQHEATDEWEREPEDEVSYALEKRLAEVPHARECGDAVVPADHDAECGDRVEQSTFGQERDDAVEHCGYRACHDGRVRRHQEPRRDLGELLGESPVCAHGEHGSCRGQERGLQAGD